MSEELERISFGLMIAALFIVGFNTMQINSLVGEKNSLATASVSNTVTGNVISSVVSTTQIQQSQVSGIDVAPKGVPSIYGEELKVSFDDVSVTNPQKADATINKLGVLDDQITLSAEEMTRYIDIAGRISCEYCCGAASIIFPNGNAACGCAHSYAMRGLAKYLLKNHGSEYTNDQILDELGKWKTLFFPGPTAAKAKILKDKGIELNYINLASNKYRGIEKGTGGSSMVGGC
ncbi:MAG: hypothetical protein HY362_04635 [Candidatus Aenigmarchaeota archaeon]|nr:hypothetical protein [Candidatus Aenigmarchaeota archaeon]